MMKLTFLGSGSAFTVGDGNYHSNMLLESEESKKKLLIDCGSDARFSLYEQGISPEEINDIYLSHLHADHVGGLEWLAFISKYHVNPFKLCLHLHPELKEELWKILSVSLNPFNDPNIDLTSNFSIDLIENNQFIWEGIEFIVFPTTHIHSDTQKMPSFGLFFTIRGKRILLTTDTCILLPTQEKLYQKADLILHDCETKQEKSGVHAHYSELRALDPAIKKKMWLYHYQPGSLPNAEQDGFLGFIKKGQSFLF